MSSERGTEYPKNTVCWSLCSHDNCHFQRLTCFEENPAHHCCLMLVLYTSIRYNIRYTYVIIQYVYYMYTYMLLYLSSHLSYRKKNAIEWWLVEVNIMAQHEWMVFSPALMYTKSIIHGTNGTVIFVLLEAHGCALTLVAFSKKSDHWAQCFRPQRLQRVRHIVVVQESLCTRSISEVLRHLM